PTAREPYLFHLARVTSPPGPLSTSGEGESRSDGGEVRLIGLRQGAGGAIEECAAESLLLLKGGQGLPPGAVRLAAGASESFPLVQARAAEVAARIAEERREALLATVPERESFLRRGFDYQEAELAAARSKLAEKAAAGDPRARIELARVKERQRR